jgi:invasion protein IalB
MRFSIAIACGAACAFVCAGQPAAAQSPQAIATFQDWSVYTDGSGASKVCYALSQPKSVLPKKARRDPIFFLISDWPARHAKAEAEIVPGYKYKDGSQVTADIGGQKFMFFTKNDANDGSAWVKELADEARLVDAMKSGSEVVVTGESERGTTTKDTYGLAGLTDALAKADATCGM